MFIHVPDEDPGRCLNFRHDQGPYGQPRRCKKGDLHDGSCEFDPPPKKYKSGHSDSWTPKTIYDRFVRPRSGQPWQGGK
jgi:hypothetical protein